MAVNYRELARRHDFQDIKDADILWITWIVFVTGGFGLLEDRAFSKGKPGLTLSGTLRRWMGIDPPKKYSRLLQVAFACGFSWLYAHLLNEIKNS